MFVKHKNPAFSKFSISFYISIKVMTPFWYPNCYQSTSKVKNCRDKIKLFVKDAGKKQTLFQDLIL